MDWYPLLNSLRIAAISAVVVFFAGIAAAYYIAKLPRLVKGVLDVLLTLPLVLPPTVAGYLLLRVLGPKRPLGAWVLEMFNVKMVMTWWSAIFATVVVIFPLMYRTVRGAFESFDETLAYSGQTLGLSNTYIFWRIRMPYCRQGVLAGTVLAFARALGEYGATSMIAGYTPGKTATISTTVYQLWQTNNDVLATKWVLVNIAISAVVLLAVNMLLMQLFTLFSYLMDGFAYAGESLAGRYVGARNPEMLRKCIRYLLAWSLVVAILYVGVYAFGWRTILSLFTDSTAILSGAGAYVEWLIVIPLIAFAPFMIDGILIGATRTAVMRNSVFVSTVVFFAAYYGLRGIAGNNALWFAFTAFLVMRGVLQYYMTNRLRII